MKAIRIHAHGGPEVLRYEDTPVPEIDKDQVLVKVYSVSVNHLDLLKASATPDKPYAVSLPWTPGVDFAGKIEQVGDAVSGFEVGDTVYGNSNGGSYAEYARVNASTVVHKPEQLSFTQAASIPHVGETAWQAIHKHGKLQAGQKVLIHGAAGAVGSFAVQFAREIGAEIYVSVSGKDTDYVKLLGAHVVIDYRTEDFTQIARDIDLVLVLVGGDIQERSYQVLKKGGRLVSTTTPILEEIARAHQVTGIHMAIEQSGKDLQEITELIESGKIQTDIAQVLPLQEAATGWKMLAGSDPSLPRITHGKIVLEVRKEH